MKRVAIILGLIAVAGSVAFAGHCAAKAGSGKGACPIAEMESQ